MSEPTEEDKIRELAARQLTAFARWIQHAQLRLKCAEIVFVSGSQAHRTDLATAAERLYQFAVKPAAADQKTD